MTVDKIWKLINVVRVRLAPRSSHSKRQATFPDNVCSYFYYFLFFFKQFTDFFWGTRALQCRAKVHRGMRERVQTPLTHQYVRPLSHTNTLGVNPVSHTNTLELLLHPLGLHHLIPCPTLPTINHVDRRSLLITVLLRTGVDNVMINDCWWTPWRYHFWLISQSHYQSRH